MVHADNISFLFHYMVQLCLPSLTKHKHFLIACTAACARGKELYVCFLCLSQGQWSRSHGGGQGQLSPAIAGQACSDTAYKASPCLPHTALCSCTVLYCTAAFWWPLNPTGTEFLWEKLPNFSLFPHFRLLDCFLDLLLWTTSDPARHQAALGCLLLSKCWVTSFC